MLPLTWLLACSSTSHQGSRGPPSQDGVLHRLPTADKSQRVPRLHTGGVLMTPFFVNTLEQLTELRKAWDLREWVYVKGHRWVRWGGASYMQGLCLLPFLLTKREAWVSIQNSY